jgi:hypothetical protein
MGFRSIRWDLIYAVTMMAIVVVALAVAWICDDEGERLEKAPLTVLQTVE